MSKKTYKIREGRKVIREYDNPVKPQTLRTRLNKLIRYLKHIEKTEPERFDLSEWIRGEGSTVYSRVRNKAVAMTTWRERYKKGKPLNCNTAACVVGHLPVLFPTSWTYSQGLVRRVLYTYKLDSFKGPHNRYEECQASENIMAEFFGGTSVDWKQIIYPEHYHHHEKDEESKVKLSVVIEKIERLKLRL